MASMNSTSLQAGPQPPSHGLGTLKANPRPKLDLAFPYKTYCKSRHNPEAPDESLISSSRLLQRKPLIPIESYGLGFGVLGWCGFCRVSNSNA